MNDDELKSLLEGVEARTRRHFDVVAERLESKIELVAEGVVGCNERIDRTNERIDTMSERIDHTNEQIDTLATTMRAEFAEVRSMIKFSHHELDRRLRTLEETVSDLQTRVERLESSTH